MPEAIPKLLIVEDDLDVAEMLSAYFRVQGYEVLSVSRGEDGVRACQTTHQDLIILDIHLPDIDGYEVARRVRGNRRTNKIPIIFLTEKSEQSDRLRGLELGADDYITKPFDVQELRLRIRNALQRANQDTLTNPVTGLSEGPLVDERLNDCLHEENWTMLIASLENLETYRETYGFVASDDVMRAVSLMVQNAVKESGCEHDFLGHLSPTDFVLITGQEKIIPLQEHIRSRLEQSLEYFYPIKNRAFTPGNRLKFKLGVLNSSEGVYASLDELKLSLLHKKK